jgi:hypothetical protein
MRIPVDMHSRDDPGVTQTSENAVPIQPHAIPPHEIGHSLLALIGTHAETPVARSPEETQIFAALSELHELLHVRLAQQSLPSASVTSTIEELSRRLQAIEERQLQTLESALEQWRRDRQSQSAENQIQMEAFQVQAQMEVNRLLRVMWLATGFAVAGAGLALILTT